MTVSKLICIKRTNNKIDLAKLYSMADMFVNPSREDNYPTVNLEALNCGTNIIVYNACGNAETLKTLNFNSISKNYKYKHKI